MKNTNTLAAFAFSAALALTTTGTFAQTGGDPGTAPRTETTSAPAAQHDDQPNYSWIGLLGLLGLAGLMRKRHDNHTHVTTTRNP